MPPPNDDRQTCICAGCPRLCLVHRVIYTQSIDLTLEDEATDEPSPTPAQASSSQSSTEQKPELTRSSLLPSSSTQANRNAGISEQLIRPDLAIESGSDNEVIAASQEIPTPRTLRCIARYNNGNNGVVVRQRSPSPVATFTVEVRQHNTYMDHSYTPNKIFLPRREAAEGNKDNSDVNGTGLPANDQPARPDRPVSTANHVSQDSGRSTGKSNVADGGATAAAATAAAATTESNDCIDLCFSPARPWQTPQRVPGECIVDTSNFCDSDVLVRPSSPVSVIDLCFSPARPSITAETSACIDLCYSPARPEHEVEVPTVSSIPNTSTTISTNANAPVSGLAVAFATARASAAETHVEPTVGANAVQSAVTNIPASSGDGSSTKVSGVAPANPLSVSLPIASAANPSSSLFNAFAAARVNPGFGPFTFASGYPSSSMAPVASSATSRGTSVIVNNTSASGSAISEAFASCSSASTTADSKDDSAVAVATNHVSLASSNDAVACGSSGSIAPPAEHANSSDKPAAVMPLEETTPSSSKENSSAVQDPLPWLEQMLSASIEETMLAPAVPTQETPAVPTQETPAAPTQETPAAPINNTNYVDDLNANLSLEDEFPIEEILAQFEVNFPCLEETPVASLGTSSSMNSYPQEEPSEIPYSQSEEENQQMRLKELLLSPTNNFSSQSQQQISCPTLNDISNPSCSPLNQMFDDRNRKTMNLSLRPKTPVRLIPQRGKPISFASLFFNSEVRTNFSDDDDDTVTPDGTKRSRRTQTFTPTLTRPTQTRRPNNRLHLTPFKVPQTFTKVIKGHLKNRPTAEQSTMTPECWVLPMEASVKEEVFVNSPEESSIVDYGKLVSDMTNMLNASVSDSDESQSSESTNNDNMENNCHESTTCESVFNESSSNESMTMACRLNRGMLKESILDESVASLLNAAILNESTRIANTTTESAISKSLPNEGDSDYDEFIQNTSESSADRSAPAINDCKYKSINSAKAAHKANSNMPAVAFTQHNKHDLINSENTAKNSGSPNTSPSIPNTASPANVELKDSVKSDAHVTPKKQLLVKICRNPKLEYAIELPVTKKSPPQIHDEQSRRKHRKKKDKSTEQQSSENVIATEYVRRQLRRGRSYTIETGSNESTDKTNEKQSRDDEKASKSVMKKEESEPGDENQRPRLSLRLKNVKYSKHKSKRTKKLEEKHKNEDPDMIDCEGEMLPPIAKRRGRKSTAPTSDTTAAASMATALEDPDMTFFEMPQSEIANEDSSLSSDQLSEWCQWCTVESAYAAALKTSARDLDRDTFFESIGLVRVTKSPLISNCQEAETAPAQLSAAFNVTSPSYGADLTPPSVMLGESDAILASFAELMMPNWDELGFTNESQQLDMTLYEPSERTEQNEPNTAETTGMPQATRQRSQSINKLNSDEELASSIYKRRKNVHNHQDSTKTLEPIMPNLSCQEPAESLSNPVSRQISLSLTKRKLQKPATVTASTESLNETYCEPAEKVLRHEQNTGFLYTGWPPKVSQNLAAFATSSTQSAPVKCDDSVNETFREPAVEVLNKDSIARSQSILMPPRIVHRRQSIHGPAACSSPPKTHASEKRSKVLETKRDESMNETFFAPAEELLRNNPKISPSWLNSPEKRSKLVEPKIGESVKQLKVSKPEPLTPAQQENVQQEPVNVMRIKLEKRITECLECEQLLDSISRVLTDDEMRLIVENCNHRPLQNQNTPDGFWNPLITSFDENDPRNIVLIDDRFANKRRKPNE